MIMFGRVASLVAMSVLTLPVLTGCGVGRYPDDAVVPVEEMQREAEMDKYNWEQEAQIERYKMDLWEEELVATCMDEMSGDFYSEDDALMFCEEYAFEFAPEPQPDSYGDGW
jgi:hypothetical protein